MWINQPVNHLHVNQSASQSFTCESISQSIIYRWINQPVNHLHVNQSASQSFTGESIGQSIIYRWINQPVNHLHVNQSASQSFTGESISQSIIYRWINQPIKPNGFTYITNKYLNTEESYTSSAKIKFWLCIIFKEIRLFLWFWRTDEETSFWNFMALKFLRILWKIS